VTDFDPFQASASSVSTFELCARKWAWVKLDGLEGAQHPSAAFGERVHGHLERWLASKVPPLDTHEERVAQAIIQHLPVPQLVLPNDVEVGLSMRLGGVYFVGRVDLYLPRHPETGRPRVYDHKTTSDFGWALAPELMVDDVQATLYAVWGLLRSKADAIDLQWTYGLTKGAPKSLPVVQTVTSAAIKDRVNKTIETARVMRELTRMEGLTAIEVPYNAEACEAYGGCPFKENCNLSAQERIESIMSQGTAQGSLLDQLRAKRNANKSPAPAPGTSSQPVNPPAASNGSAPAETVLSGVVSPIEKLRQKKAEQEKAAAAAAATTPAPAPEPETEEAPAPAAAKPGPGRPRKSRAAEPEHEAVDDLEPKRLWVAFAVAALRGGKDGSAAADDANELLLAHAELFPKE
jgi:PD-(D/E)XK nuclease superfamily protein